MAKLSIPNIFNFYTNQDFETMCGDWLQSMADGDDRIPRKYSKVSNVEKFQKMKFRRKISFLLRFRKYGQQEKRQQQELK